MSEFLLITSTFAREPILAILLVIGVVLALGALLQKLNGLAFGMPKGRLGQVKASYVPMFAHFGLVLIGGIYLPAELVTWFQNVAIAGVVRRTAMAALDDLFGSCALAAPPR